MGDDDGDSIPNTLDDCPKTVAGEAPEDGTGCSRGQLENIALKSYVQGSKPRDAAIQTSEPKMEQPAASMLHWQDWLPLIRSAWVEVLLGAAVTSLCGQGVAIAVSIKQQIPSSPRASVRLLTEKSLGLVSVSNGRRRLVIRVAAYLIFFCLVYLYRTV